MERFVIHSEEFGFFRPGDSRSLSYNAEDDFVEDVNDAKWYKDKNYAFNNATTLYPQFNTRCKRIYIVVDIADTIQTDEELKQRLKECNSLVEEVEGLSHDEVEALPQRTWNKYKSAKEFIQTYAGNK